MLLKILAGALALAAGIAHAQSKDVIVIGGALTEIVYALGAESRIAATDTTSLYPAAAQNTPKVGYQRSLASEGILALKPKMMLAAAEAGPPNAMAQIREAGVEIVSFPQEYTQEALSKRVARIAEKLGRVNEGKALEAKLDADWKRVNAKVAAYPTKPRVLFLLAHAGPTPQVSGGGTAADAMIRMAGGVNAMEGFNGYRPLTSEGVVNAKPDVILITDQGIEAQGGIAGLLARPGLSLTPAGQAKRVVNVDALLLLGFGPRMPQAVDDLATAFRKGS